MKKTRGFTIVELIVVVSIIVIITGIVLASLTTARAKSRDTKRISDIANIQLALALYLNKYGTYPAVTGVSNLTSYLIGNDKFLTVLPTDPYNRTVSGKNYTYGYASASGTSYCLGATLETTVTSVDTTATCPAENPNTGVSDNNYKVTK